MIKKVNNGLLCEYINGNYRVSIDLNATEFSPMHPESTDVNITNYDKDCLMYHENSIDDGLHGGILNNPFFNTLKPYTEIAINGWNPLSYPEVVTFLHKLRNLSLICNMLVNHTHFMENYAYFKFLVSERLINNLGISLGSISDDFIKKVQSIPNAVIHTTTGVVTIKQLELLKNKGLKVLIFDCK